MRKTIQSFFIFFILSVVLFSCSKNDDPITDDNLATGISVLNVSIQLYKSGQIDTIKLMDYPSPVNAVGVVSTNGQFSLTLKTPVSADLYAVDKMLAGLTVSDNTALISYFFNLEAFKGKLHEGDVERINDLCFQNGFSVVGAVHTTFIYCSKALTISGIYQERDTYNLSLKKGWNEVAVKITAFYDTAVNGSRQQLSYSTDIPLGLNWYFLVR